MSGTVMVQPVRSYDDEDGFKTPQSEAYPVPRAHAAELRANGLVEVLDDDVGEKAAPIPSDKRAPEAANRAIALRTKAD